MGQRLLRPSLDLVKTWPSIGKSTLLDLIAGRQVHNSGKLEGEILLNDFPVKQCDSVCKRLFGYVTQDNGVLVQLTMNL